MFLVKIESGETRFKCFVIRAVHVFFIVPMLFVGKETTVHTFSGLAKSFPQQELLEAITFQIKAGLW